jgi:hypothetical protein
MRLFAKQLLRRQRPVSSQATEEKGIQCRQRSTLEGRAR